MSAAKRKTMSLTPSELWAQLEGDDLVLQSHTKRFRLTLNSSMVETLAGHMQDWLDVKQANIDRARDALYNAGKRLVKP